MFSPADYELAARLTGLPVPRTPAEQAIAAPVVANILRTYTRATPSLPGMDDDTNIMNTGATRSLNDQPSVSQPEAKNQLERRLQAGVVTPEALAEVIDVLELIQEDPTVIETLINLIETLQSESASSGAYLSQQRPLAYDTPNFGGQYSVLNAPSSSPIPASIRYQPLS